MKKLVLVAALGVAALTTSMSAMAATATANFNVVINLTPSCVVTAPTADITLAYTSFQAGAATGSTTATIKCTTSLPYTVALDTIPTAANTGILHTEALSGAGATGPGTGAAQIVTITATAAAAQGGSCAVTAGCSDILARVLTVSY